MQENQLQIERKNNLFYRNADRLLVGAKAHFAQTKSKDQVFTKVTVDDKVSQIHIQKFPHKYRKSGKNTKVLLLKVQGFVLRADLSFKM